MKRIITAIIILSFPIVSIGQATTTAAQTSFTLEQAIHYALENGVRAKNAILDQEIAKAKVSETIGIGLPQISVSSSLQHNPTLPRFFTAYTPTSGFISLPPEVTANLNPGDAVAATNFFQLKSAGTASATLNQLIFNGSYLVGLKAAATFKDLSAKTREQTEQDIIQIVTKAFYAVLINKERTKLFDDNIARVDSLLRNTVALNQNGFAERIDVDRVKVTLNNLKADRNKFFNLNDLGIQLLKFQMNYPQDQPLEAIGSLEDVKVDRNLENLKDGWNYMNRPDYKILEVNHRLQELNIKNQYATAVPVISGFATLGYLTQSPNIGGLFSTNTNITDNGAVGPDKWYQFSQIGVNLNVPIFTGLSRTYRIQQEKIKLNQIDNNFISLKNSIDFEIKQSATNFDNAILSLDAQRENQDLAGNVARVTKTKYEQGVGSSLEVTDAENSLLIAQTNYYSALFDAMVAKVDLDKAYGRLLPSNYLENSIIKQINK